MKYSLPLFGTFCLSVLLWGACTSQDPILKDGESGSEVSPGTTSSMSDTSSYDQRSGGADTLNTAMTAPTDPTNRMPSH